MANKKDDAFQIYDDGGHGVGEKQRIEGETVCEFKQVLLMGNGWNWWLHV